MKIAVFGAGALGGFVGARLAAAGLDVVLIARGKHLAAIRRHGLQIDGPGGNTTTQPLAATDKPDTVGVVDAVVVTVKTWQLDQATAAMEPLVGSKSVVLPLLNGVEAPSQLAAAFGERRVLGGLAKIICALSAPGRIRHVGSEFIALGELDNRPSARVEHLQHLLAGAGFSVEIPADIQAAMWAKFLLVVSWGGVGAVARMPIGVLRSLPQTRRLLEQAMTEIFNLAQARGVELPRDSVAAALAFADSLPPDSTTSMQRDVAAGLPSEIDAWNGAVVRMAAEIDRSAPLHTFIYSALLPLELKSRGKLPLPQ
jgi:2-dehydropantoate 2-reductase